MAEYTPPTENVPIFDVSNFITSGTGLTESQIAGKFLRFPTGQGTETLPALITGSITAPNTMNIVMPNSASTNVLNVGVVSRNIAGQIHHYSDGDNCVAGAGVHLNNGLNNNSATNIHNGTGPNPTGTVNIMTGVDNTGNINIGRYDGAGPSQTTTNITGNTNISLSGGDINMGNTSGSITLGGTTNINTGTSATITVGNTNSTTNMYGLTNIGISTISPSPVNTTNIKSNVINIGSSDIPIDNSKTISIGARAVGGNSTTTTILGNTTISNTGGSVIIGSGGTITMSGLTTMNTGSTGSITIGANAGAITNTTNLESAIINLGNSSTINTSGTFKANTIEGTAVNSAMAIGNNITSGNINIGTSISAGDHILIGSSTTGSRVVVDGALVSNKMEGYVGSSAMGIGNNITDGSITIGSAQTGNMLLGSSSSITQVQGTLVSNSLNGKSAAANMTIASTMSGASLTIGGSLNSSGTIVAGSSLSNTTLNGTVKTNTLMPITAGGTITINSTGNGNTTIGTSGGTGSITLNRQPTIGYGITAQSIASLDTIGGRYERRLGFGNHTINTTRTALCSMNGIPAGLYSLLPYVFIPSGTVSNIEVLLVRSNAAINDGQTTGLTVINDGSETYTFASATQTNSVNSAWIYEVAASPNNNIAFAVNGSVALAGSSVYIFKAIRIG